MFPGEVGNPNLISILAGTGRCVNRKHHLLGLGRLTKRLSYPECLHRDRRWFILDSD